YLTCDHFEVDFKPSKVDPNELDPAFAVADGSVRATTRDSTLQTHRLEATMGRDEKNAIVVTDLVGKEDVHFDRTDGVAARADLLVANPVRKTATLTGKLATIARGASTIVG